MNPTQAIVTLAADHLDLRHKSGLPKLTDIAQALGVERTALNARHSGRLGTSRATMEAYRLAAEVALGVPVTLSETTRDGWRAEVTP